MFLLKKSVHYLSTTSSRCTADEAIMAMKVLIFVAFLLLALSAVDCWYYNKDGIPNWLTNPGEGVIYYNKTKKIVDLSNPSLHQIIKGHVHETLTHSLFKTLNSKQNNFTKYLGKERIMQKTITLAFL